MAFTNLPPNLKDMFYNLGDRIAKLETGPNQAMYTAVVANEEASQAIQEATQALIQAQSAYALGSQALIKDSNTITNASNQLTAINANGITVYSGSSPSSGARVIMNSAGIAGYNSGGTATFSVLASTGAVSTLGAIFTNSSIYGGDLNINGNAIITSAGYLTCYGATITGTIYASAGSFAGSVTSTSGAIGGFNIGASYLSTSNGSAGYRISTDGRAVFGFLTADTAGITNGLTLSSGTCTVSAGGNTFNNVGTFSATGVISTSSNISATGTITATGQMNANGELYASQAVSASVSAATNCYITSGGLIRKTSTVSSARYKENITDIANVPELNPKALLNLPVRAFTYKQGYIADTDDRANTMLPGFIAEEVDAIYPIAADYENDVETWNSFYLIPGLLALIQDQEARIKTLEGK
jgi:hypothetical protein